MRTLFWEKNLSEDKIDQKDLDNLINEIQNRRQPLQDILKGSKQAAILKPFHGMLGILCRCNKKFSSIGFKYDIKR